MQWNGRNKKHYESLGYTYTGKDTKFTVKVSDLQRDSHCKVQVKCQCCGKVDIWSYARFTTEYTERNKVYWCKECREKNRGWARKNNYDTIKEEFSNRGCTLLSLNYIGQYQILEYTCSCSPDIVRQITYKAFHRSNNACPECSKRSRSEKLSGDNHWNWKGGITALNIHLRNLTFDWKTEQFHRTHYKCELTGSGGELEVHHRFSFGKIVEIVLEELGVTVKPINEYSIDELQKITDLFIEKHRELSQPIVLSIEYSL